MNDTNDIIEPPKMAKNITLSVEKALSQWHADTPRQHYSQTKELFTSKQAVIQKLSDPFKKAMPIMVLFGAVMIVALIMGNIGSAVDQVMKAVGVEKKVTTYETIQQVEIVYLTPDEAEAQGIALPTIVPSEAPAPQINQIPDGTTINPDEETNPRLAGFDVMGNLLPSVPVKLGDETIVVGGDNSTTTTP